jgi:hypothetical protein
MAAFLFRGGDARGRPNSLLKSDSDYQSLFSENYDLNSFKNVISTKRTIVKLLISMYPTEGAGFRNNVVYHVLAYISFKRFHTSAHAAAGWASLNLSTTELEEDIGAVVDLFKAAGGTDQVAKSSAFQASIADAAKLKRVS